MGRTERYKRRVEWKASSRAFQNTRVCLKRTKGTEVMVETVHVRLSNQLIENMDSWLGLP